MFSSFFRRSCWRSSITASSIIGSGLLLRPRILLKNDGPSFNDRTNRPSSFIPKISGQQSQKISTTNRDLCLGSISGLFLGSLIGKFSTLLVFLTLSTYLFLQFLENRGIIYIPWNRVTSFANQQIDLKDLVMRRLSFKLSFSAAFLIAAYNI